MNPLNARVRSILRREYLQRVRSRWFLLSTLGLPLLLVGLSFLSVWFIDQEAGEVGTYRTVVIDRTDRLAPLVVEELATDSIPATVDPGLARVPDDSLSDRLLDSPYDLIIALPVGLLEGGADIAGRIAPVRLLGREGVAGRAGPAVTDAVHRAVVRARLLDAGVQDVDTRALIRKPPVTTVSVFQEGARSQEIFRAISFILALVFYMVLLVYGQMIVRSVIEEKTSDIVEIIVSSVRPWELMLGKIIGVGAVGLTQLAIWAGVLGGLTLFGLTGGAVALAELGLDPTSVRIPPGLVTGILAFLALGYLLYAGLFAGAGATISNEQDAQQVTLPIIFLIVVPFLLVQGVIENPDTALSILASMIPFFSPLLMPSRLLVTRVPTWELATSLLILVASILLVAWIAGRIYRVGILMKGKRPNVPELLRWVRHG